MDLSAPLHPPPAAAAARVRGPFARWPRTADAVLALAMLLFTTLLADGPGDTMVVRELSEVPIAVFVVFSIASAALWWRRRHPLAVTGVALLSMVVLLGTSYADTGGAVIIGLYSTGRYSDRRGWGEAASATGAVLLILDGLFTDLPWGDVGVGVVVMVAALYLGRSRRLRDERAAQWVREQASEQRRVVAEERTRIARELHDVVAHRVSLMTVQAGAAVTVADHDPAAARRAMVAVEEAGRQALDELRHLLGVLRPVAPEGTRDPQPTIADLDGLADRVRAAGVTLTLDVDVPDDPPARVQVSGYRIVQESLTNVLKHAGAGARASVSVRGDRAGIRVEVIDDGGTARGRSAAPDGGHGIVGMRERAVLLGGRLDVGPTGDGGFRVVAVLPTSLPDSLPETMETS